MGKKVDIDYLEEEEYAEPVLLPFSFYATNQEIHLGIQTNILCIKDRLPINYGLDDDEIENVDENSPLQDFTATLYLGKIIFEKNKKGILAPKFIPSNLTDSSFEKLNTFWLNEINKNAKKPFRSLIKCEHIKRVGNVCSLDEKAIPYQKIHYFRHKDNIILTKEQIISYFTQLHQENTEFIANYIESINKNNGINAYHLHDKIYDDLLSKGILQKDMFKWWSNAHKAPYTQAVLLTLDFLSKTNQPNHKILLYDELFYAYLVWSLREFLIESDIGEMQAKNNLLFNSGVYKTMREIKKDKKDEEEDEEDTDKPQNFFSNLDYSGRQYKFTPLNIDTSDFCNDKEPCSLREDIFNKITKVKPSPLGKYYFELSDNKSVYIEFFPRIYPSITNLPKGWSKEMMQKLDLKLE
ncbi:hypothetical protein [Helicobacter sp. T3_23-1059]